MPKIDNGRERVISNAEWARLSVELANYPNPHVAPLTCLMLETAMRSCEPLVTLCWKHINWEQRYIDLPNAKAGGRHVPLSPGALHILKQLHDHAAKLPQPDDRLFPTTYEAVKKGWAVAREAAGIPDVNLHDLRHTSATRFALEFKGNVPVLMVITGHKTVQMVMHYVTVNATDVATMMHNEELDVQHAAAGYGMGVTAALDATLAAAHPDCVEPQRVGESRQAIQLTQGQGVCRTAEARPGSTGTEHPPTPRGRSNVVFVAFGRGAA